MTIKNMIHGLMLCLYVAIFYPIFIQIVLFKAKRKLLISYTIISNIIVFLLIIVIENQYYNKLYKELYYYGKWMPVCITGIILFYIIFLEKFLRKKFGSENYSNKEIYINNMRHTVSSWKSISFELIIVFCIFLPLGSYINYLKNLNIFIEIIIVEFMLLSCFFSFREGYKRFILEIKKVEL